MRSQIWLTGVHDKIDRSREGFLDISIGLQIEVGVGVYSEGTRFPSHCSNFDPSLPFPWIGYGAYPSKCFEHQITELETPGFIALTCVFEVNIKQLIF